MAINLKNKIKKLDKKIISLSLVITFLSTILCSLPNISSIYKTATNSDFYDSTLFNEAVNSLVYNGVCSILDTTSESYTKYIGTDQASQNASKDMLLNQRNIAYLITNADNGEIISNRGIRNDVDLEKFKDFKKIVSINVKNNNVSGISNYVTHSGIELASLNDNITLKFAFPTNLDDIEKTDLNTENADVTYLNYNLFMKDRFITISKLSIVIISLIGFLLSYIQYKKNKNEKSYYLEKLYNFYKDQMIEFKIGVIVLFLIISLISPAFGLNTFFNILGILSIICMITTTLLLLKDILVLGNKNNIFKNSLLKKFNINKVTDFKKRTIILLSLLTLLEFSFIYISVYSFAFPSGILLCEIILFNIIIYLYFKRSFNDIAILKNGTKILAEGNLDYKIQVNDTSIVSDISTNINNLGDGFKIALENDIKNERMKTELITNVSHDLKTPLTSILNYIDLLKKEELVSQQSKDYVNILDQKSKRLKTLIDDLFEASKATSGNIQLELQKIEIKRLLTQSIAEMEENILASKLDIKLNEPIDKIYVHADGKKLFRVFENLLSNICKYSLEKTRVYIDTTTDEDFVYISMKNISSYELNFNAAELTERFKRGDTSRNTEGSGLGLSIVKGFIELHKGTFEIQIDGDLFKTIIKLPLLK